MNTQDVCTCVKPSPRTYHHQYLPPSLFPPTDSSLIEPGSPDLRFLKPTQPTGFLNLPQAPPPPLSLVNLTPSPLFSVDRACLVLNLDPLARFSIRPSPLAREAGDAWTRRPRFQSHQPGRRSVQDLPSLAHPLHRSITPRRDGSCSTRGSGPVEYQRGGSTTPMDGWSSTSRLSHSQQEKYARSMASQNLESEKISVASRINSTRSSRSGGLDHHSVQDGRTLLMTS